MTTYTKQSMGYMDALKGWTGYSKEELIDGKYRPLFGDIKGYKSPNKKRNEFTKEEKYIRVPMTIENIQKQICFNIKYGAEGYGVGAILSSTRYLKQFKTTNPWDSTHLTYGENFKKIS